MSSDARTGAIRYEIYRQGWQYLNEPPWVSLTAVWATTPERAFAEWGKDSEHGNTIYRVGWDDEEVFLQFDRVADGPYDFQTSTDRAGRYRVAVVA